MSKLLRKKSGGSRITLAGNASATTAASR